MKAYLLAATAALTLATVGGTAQAGVVYDTLTVYDSTDTVLETVTATPSEIEAQQLVGLQVAVDTSQYGNYGLLVDAQNDILDIYGICFNCGDDLPEYALAFQAEPTGYPAITTTLATGAPIDVTQYLSLSLQSDGDTAYFTASGNVTIGDVPEPASLALLGVGLAGVVSLRRREAT